jgi:hypothetical protein
LALLLFGRRSAARLEIDGPKAAQEALASTRLGI